MSESPDPGAPSARPAGPPPRLPEKEMPIGPPLRRHPEGLMRPGFALIASLLAVLLQAEPGFTEEPAAAARPLRRGIAGLSHGHVQGILQNKDRKDVEIVGIAERDRALALRYAERFGLPKELLFDDVATMIERAHPEAVAAFGPTLDHLAVVEACAPRRVPVMVEKPLAIDLAAARRIAELAKQHGIPVLTNYETTWHPSNHRLYDLVVRRGAFGGIRKMVIHDGHAGPVAIGVEPDFMDWLTDPVRNGGGALMDFGCYGADLATWLMGGQRPLSVTAVTQQLQPKLYPRVDDEATIVLAYPQAQAILQASWNWPFGRKDTHVYGEKGYVLTLDSTNLRSRVVPSDGEARIEAEPLPAPRNEPFAWLAAVAHGQAVPADDLGSLETNLVVMEILDAARESARGGRTVQLDAR
jgi:predicted dehydrogenase